MRYAYSIQTPNSVVEVNCINEAGISRLPVHSGNPKVLMARALIVAKETIERQKRLLEKFIIAARYEREMLTIWL